MAFEAQIDVDYRNRNLSNNKILLNNLLSVMYAGYVFSFNRPEPSNIDFSGNNRLANISTAQVDGNSYKLGTLINSQIVYPFTTADLAAATNSFTIAAFVKSPGLAYIAGSVRGSQPAVQLVQDTTNNGKATIVSDGVNTHNTLDSNNVDPNRGTRYEMIAAKYTTSQLTIYRRHANLPLIVKNLVTAKTLGGTYFMRSGMNDLGTGYATEWNLASIFFFNIALTDLQIDNVYDEVKSYLLLSNIVL